jgi:hypothetical protein
MGKSPGSNRSASDYREDPPRAVHRVTDAFTVALTVALTGAESGGKTVSSAPSHWRESPPDDRLARATDEATGSAKTCLGRSLLGGF